MPEISSVSPGRGRAGDPALTIAGAGFAPSSPFGNAVEFDGVAASPSSQSETTIVVAPPACSGTFGLCVTDQWILLLVQRIDTAEWDAIRWWIKADLADLKTASGLTEKIPTDEDLDNPTNECLTAATWNRLATFVEFLAHEVLTAKGSIIARDGVGIAEVLVGTNGYELRRVPAGEAGATGLGWGPPKRIWTYRWGLLIDAANVRNGPMSANGAGDDSFPSTKRGTHGMATDGVLRHLTVNVESGGSDTLDQVTVIHNLLLIHDSGTGLAIGADDAYRFDLGTWFGARDLEVRAFKTGTTATMALTATLAVEEEVRTQTSGGVEELLSDAIAVTDVIDAEVILGTDPLEAAIAVTDSLAVEVQAHVEFADAMIVAGELATEAAYHRELADAIDAHDTIEAVLL